MRSAEGGALGLSPSSSIALSFVYALDLNSLGLARSPAPPRVPLASFTPPAISLHSHRRPVVFNPLRLSVQASCLSAFLMVRGRRALQFVGKDVFVHVVLLCGYLEAGDS